MAKVHAQTTDEAKARVDEFTAVNRVSISGLIEAFARALPADVTAAPPLDWYDLVVKAGNVDAQRRQRGGPKAAPVEAEGE